MSRYHVNPETGNPGRCTATISCPFGGAEEHYGSAELAREAYEDSMGTGVTAGLSSAPEAKKEPTEKEWREIAEDLADKNPEVYLQVTGFPLWWDPVGADHRTATRRWVSFVKANATAKAS